MKPQTPAEVHGIALGHRAAKVPGAEQRRAFRSPLGSAGGTVDAPAGTIGITCDHVDLLVDYECQVEQRRVFWHMHYRHEGTWCRKSGSQEQKNGVTLMTSEYASLFHNMTQFLKWEMWNCQRWTSELRWSLASW